MTVLSAFISALSAQAVVKKLTGGNFDETINQNNLVLVKFTAPWCGHCKALNPEFEAASDLAVEKDYVAKHGEIIKDVVFADVDVTEEEALGSRFQIQGYPTIKFFRDGVAQDYDGGRTKDKIMDWVVRYTKDAVTPYETCEAGVADNQGDNIVCITHSDDKFLEKASKKASANRVKDIVYISVKGETDKIEMYRIFDMSTPISLGTEEEFTTKMLLERLPYFGPVDGESFSKYMGTDLDFVWMAGNKEQMDQYSDNLTKLGKEYRGQLNFVWLDSDQFQRQAEGMLGISEFPAIVRTVDGPGRFIFRGDHTNHEALTKWVEQMKNKEIEPELKSEEIPETNTEPVKVVVGKNFTDIVANDKDVMLEIYAPWCGHCKKLAPIYDDVASKLAELSPSVTIAKIDGTANEIAEAGYEFQGFPTLYWKPAGGSPTLYSGGRELDDIMSFISENASTSFKWTPEKADTPKEDDEL